MTLHAQPDPQLSSTPWRERAACRDADEALFFPPDDLPADEQAAYAEQALALCRRCPVQLPCLSYSLVSRQQYGVWGGLAPAERLAG